MNRQQVMTASIALADTDRSGFTAGRMVHSLCFGSFREMALTLWVLLTGGSTGRDMIGPNVHDGQSDMPSSLQLSHAARDALNQICGPLPRPLRPDVLEGILLHLELSRRLTVSQILLRRELRRMTPDERQSLIREIVGSFRD